AGFMFGNRLFQQQPDVIEIAMAAEAWHYAIFDQDQRPVDFDDTVEWVLPKEAWPQIVYWGTPESDLSFNFIMQAATELLDGMDIDTML
ncbi:hypothetical protein FRC11_011456, partial [Ceratobasidium sp. 423]